jgi:hypothetical protein
MTGMDPARARLLGRPTIDTKFHIDYSWWERADRELEIFLRSHLCREHQASYAQAEADMLVDFVDRQTGEVTRVPGIQHVLMTHCARQPEYINPQSSLVDAVFRILLASGNTPLSPRELGERLNRPPNTILRTFSGPRVYKGVRPWHEG